MSSSANTGDQPRHQQLRTKFRLRRWHVTFGNPALGTYNGSIVSLHHRRSGTNAFEDGGDINGEDQDNSRSSGDEDSDGSSSDDSSVSSCDSFSSCSLSFEAEEGDDEDIHDMANWDRIVVMTNVPPHQVPDGVINLVRSHRPFIEQVRIVIGMSPAEESEQRRKRRLRRSNEKDNSTTTDNINIRQRSQTWACENDEDDTEQVNHSLAESLSATSITNLHHKQREEETVKSNGDTTTITKSARSSSLGELAFKQYDTDCDFNNHYNSILEEKKENTSSDHENDNKSYLILFVLDSKESAQTFVSDIHHRPYTTLDETETCSVYHTLRVEGEDGVTLLGPLFASSTSPPSPNNQSLTTTASKQQHNMDDHQCPVCLEKMSLDASSSILTTVCNHSFHINCLAQWQDSPCPVCRFDHSGLNEALSRCHICSNTVGNYVCLICGVISCAKGSSQFADISHNGAMNPSDQLMPSQRGHAFQHYEQTLHAYALDTENQHVFDFAGGGYVHRLLQNIEDGKIVEGTDPRVVEDAQIEQLLGRNDAESELGTSSRGAMERSTIPTYSTVSEDDEAIHRKLEGYAGQYYTLLKSQLEQQRIYYEGRLEAIRREDVSVKAEQSTSNLISALKQQRHQLEQRSMTLRKKHKKVSDDAKFLENMNETLEADKLEFRNRIAEAQAELARAKEQTKSRLAPLDEELSALMLQLENGFDSKPAAK